MRQVILEEINCDKVSMHVHDHFHPSRILNLIIGIRKPNIANNRSRRDSQQDQVQA